MVLGVPEETAQREAAVVEHCVSRGTAERLEQYMSRISKKEQHRGNCNIIVMVL